MRAIIYQPTKSAMQSGLANCTGWILKFEGNEKSTDSLTGWTGSKDTLQQLTMSFEGQKEAVAFAEKNQIEYELILPNIKKVKPNSYADNFI